MKHLVALNIILLLFFFNAVTAQPKYNVVHYSTEDGLPQKNIMDIAQDKKGFMWFSTWDGICKFDGSVFYSYKINKRSNQMRGSSRFDKMLFDKYGFIWITSRESEVYRFDPRTEDFRSLATLPEFKNRRFRVSKNINTPSGRTWLTDKDRGFVCFPDTRFATQKFNHVNPEILKSKVEWIHEDGQKNTWLLTDNGLIRFSPDLKHTHTYFDNKSTFFCDLENDNELWFGSNRGLIYIYRKSSDNFTVFNTGQSTDIKMLKKIDEGKVIICTGNNEFAIYDDSDKSLQKFTIAELGKSTFTKIRGCYVDSKKNIWLETNEDGVSKFNLKTHDFKHLQIKVKKSTIKSIAPRFFIWEDINGRLWLQQHGGGLAFYDPDKEQLISMANNQPANGTKFSGMLYDGYTDIQGNLWVSTGTLGLEKIIFDDAVFKAVIVDSAGNDNVRSILEDHLHRLWVATKDEKIAVYDSAVHKLGLFTSKGIIGKGTSLSGPAYTMIEDAQKNIWIGTKGKGVYKLVPNAAAKQYKINHYQYSKTDPYSLSDDKIYNIYQDNRGRIWIGSYMGGLNLADNTVDGRFYNYHNLLKNYPIKQSYHIRSIAEDHSGKIYLGTTTGLVVFEGSFIRPELIQFKCYGTENKDLAGHDIFDICVTRNNTVYLATFKNGFYRITGRDRSGYPNGFFNYTTENGLSSNLVSQIKEDDKGHLWIISEPGVTRFDPVKNIFENYYDINRLVKEDNFSEGGDIKTKSGQLVLGTTGGFIIGQPNRIKPHLFKPYLALTGLQLANRRIAIGDTTPVTENIDDLKKLELTHKQNFITVEFAALDFANNKEIQYAYKLDGIDNDWETTYEKSARYNNLPPGKYQFHVKSTNGKGIWLNNEHLLQIVIVPAMWQTWWARIIFLFILLALAFFISRWVILFYRLKDRLVLEKEQTEMKASFFTDISHEIRTPLTMIVSPVEHILETNAVNPTAHNQLQLVLKNAKRMLRLVNQILDFRKIQNKVLTVRETVAGSLIADIASDFLRTADLEGIKLTINDRSNGLTIWLDQESVERMMYNLLSNAVKHTPKGRKIEVNIFPFEGKMAIQVKDNGQGMSREVLKKLFSKFVSYHPDKNKPSTGIGLSIVKEIVERHGAEIKVESTERKGSTFTILFRMGVAHFSALENIEVEEAKAVKNTSIENIPDLDETPVTINATEETILLIEDDDDLRNYIAGLLADDYRVLQAADGQEGLAIASKELPDFIISDIMMPKKNGFEFLDALRKQQLTSHIPVIFLTAKTDQATELDAYESGADAFITKPFSTKFLRSRIRTIIGQRKRLYLDLNHKIAGMQSAAKIDSESLNLNERFLLKVRSEIENNISNSEFNVDDLIATMPMSRNVFVKKLKSLTGHNPVEYIRTIKIMYAAKLINTKQYSIKEIAHMVGINDPKYFSQRFKEVMGLLPSEYKSGVK